MNYKNLRYLIYMIAAVVLFLGFACSQEIQEKIIEDTVKRDKTKLDSPVLTVEPLNGKSLAQISDNEYYYEVFNVKMATSTEGAEIWYTFDGSVPSSDNKNALKYSEPVAVTRYRQIKTIVTHSDSKYKSSDVEVFEYKLRVRKPSVTIADGKIKLDCTTDTATIKYSLESEAKLYSEPLTYGGDIEEPAGAYYLYAVAQKEGWMDSPLSSFDNKAPAEVENFSAIPGKAQVTLTWRDPSDADFTKVEITYGDQKVEKNKGEQSVIITGLTNDTEYTFTLKTIDSSGNKSVGKSVKATPKSDIVADTTPPNEVANLIKIEGNAKVKLSWSAPGDSDFKKVEITYLPDGANVLSVEKGVNFYEITSLTNGTEYTFTLKSVDITGNKSVGKTIKATPKADAVADTTPPGDVSGLSAEPGNGQIILSWSDPGDVDFVKVYIKYGSETKERDKGEKSATITGLTNDTEYTFTVITEDSSGNKSVGKTIKSTPKSDIVADTTPPAEVNSLSATPGNGSVIISWTDPTDSDLAKIEITYNSQTLLVNKGQQSVTITGLTNDTSYTFKLKTLDNKEPANKSAGIEVSATPRADIVADTTPPAEATSLTATPGSTKVKLQWLDPSDSDFAKVEITYTPNGTTPIYVDKGVKSYEVTGLTNGTLYTFTIKTLDNKDPANVSSGATVTGTPAAVLVSSVEITKSSTSLAVGGEEILDKTVSPTDATNPTLDWVSSDDSIVTVDQTGKIKGIAAGNATITATSKDGSNKSDTCTVTVSATSIAVTGVILSKTTLDLVTNGTNGETLTATIDPADATNQNITWSISPSGIATVVNGVVTATSNGTATVTVTTADGSKTATCTVKVKTLYTVNFETYDGGTVANQSVYNDGKVTKPTATLSKTGYTFGGWYKGTNGTGDAWVFDTDTVSANTTIYAKWTASTYTVTFSKQDGLGGSDTVTATYGSSMPSASAPSRSGYTFAGYYDAASGGTQYYNASMTSVKTWDKTSSATLYAQWTITNYTITYMNVEGATNSNPTSYNIGSSTITLGTLTKDGYTFGGWYTNEALTTSGNTITTGSTGNKTFYAKWVYGSGGIGFQF